jgi:hypothetical protein
MNTFPPAPPFPPVGRLTDGDGTTIKSQVCRIVSHTLKANASIASLASFDFDTHFVNKLKRIILRMMINLPDELSGYLFLVLCSHHHLNHEQRCLLCPE